VLIVTTPGTPVWFHALQQNGHTVFVSAITVSFAGKQQLFLLLSSILVLVYKSVFMTLHKN
jgi:hypothetical protein